MISTLLNQVASFFGKDFFFASFLPAILFTAACAITLAFTAGIAPSWAVFTGPSFSDIAKLGAAGGFALVVFAYVLNSLRAPFARFWSGMSNGPLFLLWGFLRLLEARERRRFDRLAEVARRESPWGAMWKRFETLLIGKPASGKPVPDAAHVQALQEVADSLARLSSPEQVEQLLRRIAGNYLAYESDSFGTVYKTAKLTIMERHALLESQSQTAATELDRRFGARATIRPTALGNAIESYNQYPFTRYRMEGELFWPRIRATVESGFLAVVDEPRILLDFALAMATLSLAFGWLALLAGPWLAYAPGPWLLATAGAWTTSWLFYRLAVSTSAQLGEAVRATFDLYRLELMTKLGLPRPASYVKEKEQWTELSHLIVYGRADNFDLAPKS